MKFNIDKDALLKEIEIAQKIISTKNAISTLSHVFIEASFGGMLTIRATDIQISFEASIPASVAEAGETTVFCEELAEILVSLPAGEISFLSNGETTTIKPLARRAFFLVKADAADKWLEACAARCPCNPSSQDVEFFSIPARSLKKMIRHTVFAVSNGELRRFMSGVFAEKEDGFLKFVATDGRRLAVISTKIEGAFPDFDDALIPVGILKAIAATCPDEGIVSMGFDKSRVFFRFEEIEASALLILGEQFPNYRRVIPESQSHSLLVSRNDLRNALKLISIFASKCRSKRLRLDISAGCLKISVRKDEVAVAGEDVDCEYEGEDFTMALNFVYLEETAKAIKCEKLRIEFTEPMKALTIRGEGEEDFFHIIMPMQLD